MRLTADDEGREAELRAYLLGALPDARLEEIDEQVIADVELHAEMQATADDLIHAYLAGELSAGDRERFESHFLASPRRRERVAFVRDLVSAVERAHGAEAVAASKPAAAAPRPSRLATLLPWAAALMVGVTAGGWGLGERRLREREEAAALRNEATLQQRLAEQDARVKELETATSAALPSNVIPTWNLRSNTERGPAAANTITVSGEWVRLRVELEHDLRVASYRASLQTPEGRELLRYGGLSEKSGPGRRTLDVIVPARLLDPGDYVLSIQRDAPGDPDELTAAPIVVAR